MDLRWRPDRTASCLHALDALRRGLTLTDAALAAALQEASVYLLETLESHRVPAEEFFDHALPLAFGGSLRETAQTALAKVRNLTTAQALAGDVASQLAHLQALFDRAVPDATEQLRLRVEPLRLQWEARGPGLLAALSRLMGPELLVDEATVILVQPVLGGAGRAHHRYNSVSFEAVLTNPLAELPETLRMGWLLAQLNLDLPVHQGDLPRQRVLSLGGLALAAAVLAAAEEVELARLDEPTLRAALVGWDVYSADDASLDGTVSTLTQWWDVYRQQPPSLRVALSALDQMLA